MARVRAQSEDCRGLTLPLGRLQHGSVGQPAQHDEGTGRAALASRTIVAVPRRRCSRYDRSKDWTGLWR